MKYIIDAGIWRQAFAVPGCVVEKYIKLASGSALKVLLFMLYNNDQEYSSEELAAALNIPNEAAEDAFCFWEQVNVLHKEGTAPPAHIPAPEKPVPAEVPPERPRAETGKVRQRSTAALTPREIAERAESSHEVAFLFSSAEGSLKHLLTHTEQRSLLWIHDYLGLPADVILMLLEYCRVIDKLSVRYIEAVAVSWQEKDIFTHEEAEREIRRLKERRSLTGQILSAFGINRKLSSREEEYIAEWVGKNYDIDMISYAYDKTIDAINKLSFPYINKILNVWYTKGLVTREQVNKENEGYSKNFTGKEKEHSYDLDEFDRLALNYTPKVMNESEE